MIIGKYFLLASAVLALGLIGPAGLRGQILTTPTLSSPASVPTKTWATAISSLSQSDDLLVSVTVPNELLSAAQGTTAWHMQRAGLLLSAADSAKKQMFFQRHGQLLQTAERDLLKTLELGPASRGEHAQCAYLLGHLAERLHGDVPGAAAYYQQAVAADPTNVQAANALARVQAILAFRRSLRNQP